jgi:polyhydroxybutyrate depolymerase
MRRYILFFALLCCFSELRALTLVKDSIVIEGISRTFHYSLPSKTKNAAVMFVLHMSGSHGREISMFCDSLSSFQDEEKFILVFPDGYKGFWNECRKMSSAEANRMDIDEQSFFRGMIGYFKKKFRASDRNVFAAGSSGGGHMAYKLALTMPGEIRAIAAILANMPDSANFDCVASGVAMPVMIINSTADEVNPYYGGEIKAYGVVLGTVMSTHATFQYWLDLAGYHTKPFSTDIPDRDPFDGAVLRSSEYVEKGKPKVALITIEGGGHWYPGDIDVHVEAWKFFSSESKRKYSRKIKKSRNS